MKEKIYGIIVGILFLLALVFATKISTTYTREGTVIKINENNFVTVKDDTNNLWEFKPNKILCVGDKIKLYMNNVNTSTIKDDKINKKKKITLDK